MAAIAAVLVVTLVAVLTQRSIASLVATRAQVDRSNAVVQMLDGLLIALDDTETGQRGYVITGDPAFLAPYDKGVIDARAGLRELRKIVGSTGAQALSLGQLEKASLARIDHATTIVEERRKNGFEGAAALIGSGRGRRIMDAVRASVSTMKGRESLLLRRRRAEADRSLIRAGIVSALGIVIAAALALLAILLMRRTLIALAEGRRTAGYARTLIDSARDGIYGLDAQGRVTFANRTMAETLGYDLSEILGSHAHALFHHTMHDGSPYPVEACPMYHAIRGEFEGRADDELIWRHDGTSLPVEYSISKVSDPQGNSGAVISFRDISDRQAANIALRTAKDAAEAANEAKSDFLARMSHELRTPLNSVIGFANVLLRNRAGNLAEQEISYLERIQKNGVSLLSLINDILDLSKIEAGRMEVDITPVDIGGLIGEVVAQFETQIAGRHIELDAVIPEVIAPLDTDHGKLRQILTNLLGNAVKFTESGTVTISVAVDPGTHAARQIDVSDSGVGIPPDRLGAIFDAFEQAERSTTRRFGGTGLGLPISRSLCALLGYELRVLSKEGVGSTFIIDLEPRVTPAIASADVLYATPADNSSNEALLAGKTVLIVDDSADDRLLIANQVMQFGGRCIEAMSGSEAIELARTHRPDLITLDLLMPRMDGSEVLRLMKADPDLRNIPIVVVSSVASERAGLVGALSLIPKPIMKDDLQAAFRRGLGLGKVLIVDDDVDTQQLLANYAYDEGASEVRVVGDGESALAVLEHFAPDIVLLDMVLPRRDGMDVLSQLAGREDVHSFSVIIVTGKELTSAESKTAKLSSAGILRKGEHLEKDLRAAFRDLVGQRKRGGAPVEPQ